MTADDDARALRDIARELGLEAAPPPPRSSAPAPDAEWVDRLLARVEEQAADVVELPVRRQTPLRSWAAAACAVLVLVAGGAVLARPTTALASPPVLTFSEVAPAGLSPHAGAPAQETLREIARSAREQADRERDPSATVQHVSTEQWRLELVVDEGRTQATVRPTANDSWLLPDGRVRYREVATAPEFSPGGQLTAAGQQAGDLLRDEVMSTSRDPLRAERLPRDGASLLDAWVDESTPPGGPAPTDLSVLLIADITDLFSTWVVDPGLAAAAWEALATQEDVRDLGDVRDRAGRVGRGFGVWDESNQTLEILVVDEVDGALLGAETVLFAYPGVDAPRPLDEPQVGAFVVHLASDWVAAP